MKILITQSTLDDSYFVEFEDGENWASYCDLDGNNWETAEDAKTAIFSGKMRMLDNSARSVEYDKMIRNYDS